MNDAHWHLMLNHFPVIGTIFSLITLLAGIILKDAGIRKAGLGLFVLTALLTIPAYLTGEDAEHVVEEISRGSGRLIHAHEEWGEKVLWTCIISGLLSAVALWGDMAKKSFVRILIPIIAIFSLVNSVLLKYTATSGGEIMHQEIRTSQATITGNAPENGSNTAGENTNANDDNDKDND